MVELKKKKAGTLVPAFIISYKNRGEHIMHPSTFLGITPPVEIIRHCCGTHCKRVMPLFLRFFKAAH